MKTILLKLSGPLQSWGTGSRFETRDTDLYPSKSAIIGMIGAALGYSRDDDEKIVRLNELDFGVRVDRRGQLHKDYHIAQKYNDKGGLDRTYVTNRYYIEDGVFLVAIGHEDESFIDEIYEGLKNPYYQMFMGRRSCPLPGDFLLEPVKEDIVTALENCKWQVSEKMANTNESEIKLRIHVDGDLLDIDSYEFRQDYVESFSQKGREFGYRAEKKKDIIINNPYYKPKMAEHDIFAVIGGEDVSI